MCSTGHILFKEWTITDHSGFLSHNIMHLFCAFNQIITHSAVAFLQAFGNILNLVPLAESVVKLNAVCMQCFKEAAYTKRIGAEKEVSRRNKEAQDEGTSLENSFSLSSELSNMPIIFVLQVEIIGGADKYQAVCRKCYGGLMDKENSFLCRDETPPHDHSEKLKDSAVPRKLFSTLYL